MLYGWAGPEGANQYLSEVSFSFRSNNDHRANFYRVDPIYRHPQLRNNTDWNPRRTASCNIAPGS
jgi:hypothetical protein